MKAKISDQGASDNSVTDIIKKGSIITIITLISRPIGYVRESIQAYLFGATLAVDAFVVAFNFPELIQTLFFSGATSAFLIPVCTKYLKNDKEYSDIYATFINLTIIITLFLSTIFFIFSNEIVQLIAPGFSPESKRITKTLFIIMIPVIALHAILSVIKAFLNAKEHFAAPEMSGILWNIVFILAALFLSKKFGIYSLAIGVTIGSIFQIIVQFPYLKKFNIRYSMVLSLNHQSVRDARRLFAGALIATSIVPINSFVGRIIGSYLPHGEVASLAYAFRVFILPFSLFAVPVYTVMFSKIAKLYHEKDLKGIYSNIDGSFILLCITLIPSTILLCSTGDSIIKILYERGAFTSRETLMTNRALFGYGTGILFYALSLSLVRVFNALHDMKTPAVIGITSIVINAMLAALLMKKFNNLGISLATSIVSLYNFSVLYICLKKKIKYRMAKSTIREITKSLLSGIVLLFSIFAVRSIWHDRTYLTLSLSIILTIIIYYVFFRDYYRMLIRRKI
ncbi:MAG: murein biosynthesis integral membrane protein MurJ [Proteobacteria bacterium]|nr:murein biosynthesis integral membrane protein MurJ [Pseudomonadota bacterium]